MIKEIVKDEAFLSQKSTEALEADLYIATDLLDTLEANKEGCVGLAANMIGYLKNIIAVDDEGEYLVMINPKIIKYSEPFKTEEGCLSLVGTRPTKRYKSIKVEYQNEKMQKRIKTYKGFTAQIIQHEIDHCEGIII